MSPMFELRRFWRKFTVALFPALVCSVSGPALAAPKTAWKNQSFDLRTKPDQEKITVEFRFKNVGDAPLKLWNLHSSCGCTIAALERSDYAPGEEGAVKVDFTIGSRIGEQEKTIQVDTNDERQPKAYLKLHVTIPAAVALKPSTLTWTKSEPATPKKVQAIILPEASIQRFVARSSNSNLEVDVSKVGEKEFRITVTPKSTEVPIRAVITLTADWPAQKPKTILIYVIVA